MFFNIKCFSFILIIFTLNYCDPQSTTVNLIQKNTRAVGFQEKLLVILHDLRIRMQMEIPSLGLPILEPLQIESLDIDITHEIGTIAGEIENLKVVGLSTFVTKRVDFILGGLFFILDMTIPDLLLTGLFDLNGVLMNGMFPIYGKGDFEVNIRNLHVDVNLKVKYSQNEWSLPNITIKISIEEMKANFKGLYGGDNEYEEFVNSAFSELGPQILDELWPDFEPIINDQIREQFIFILKDITLVDLLQIINGNESIFPPLPFN